MKVHRMRAAVGQLTGGLRVLTATASGASYRLIDPDHRVIMHPTPLNLTLQVHRFWRPLGIGNWFKRCVVCLNGVCDISEI